VAAGAGGWVSAGIADMICVHPPTVAPNAVRICEFILSAVVGRLTGDDVTLDVGTGVDDAVTKLGYSLYDAAGRLRQVSSYDDLGAVVNQAERQ